MIYILSSMFFSKKITCSLDKHWSWYVIYSELILLSMFYIALRKIWAKH